MIWVGLLVINWCIYRTVSSNHGDVSWKVLYYEYVYQPNQRYRMNQKLDWLCFWQGNWIALNLFLFDLTLISFGHNTVWALPWFPPPRLFFPPQYFDFALSWKVWDLFSKFFFVFNYYKKYDFLQQLFLVKFVTSHSQKKVVAKKHISYSEYELWNVFSEMFFEFTLGKVRDLNSKFLFALVQRQKWKTGKWKRV
jgi:hypothetical protein